MTLRRKILLASLAAMLFAVGCANPHAAEPEEHGYIVLLPQVMDREHGVIQVTAVNIGDGMAYICGGAEMFLGRVIVIQEGQAKVCYTSKANWETIGTALILPTPLAPSEARRFTVRMPDLYPSPVEGPSALDPNKPVELIFRLSGSMQDSPPSVPLRLSNLPARVK